MPTKSFALSVVLAVAACSSGAEMKPRPTPPPGNPEPSGGSGAAPGSLGAGGGGGSGGSAPVAGSGGATPTPVADAAAPPEPTPDGGPSALPPSAPGQGPVSPGTIVFSNDFEQDIHGMSRSPGGLPEDRIQIVDDPISQRGKVVRIKFNAGDNFRTSAGTQPRSWFSSSDGYTIPPGTNVSVSWGFMWENVNMGAHFAQIIRDGGPLWMFDVDGAGNVKADVHRGSGSTGTITKLEPMKWYDFRVDTDYKAGGTIKFYLNGKLAGMGKGDGGAPARFDCGIYWAGGNHPARTVYVSNVSIAKM